MDHGDNEEDIGILCQKRMLKWVVEHVGWLRVFRVGSRNHIRENKRVCDNLTVNKNRQSEARREGGNEEGLLECSSLCKVCPRCRQIYTYTLTAGSLTSVRCSSALSEKMTPDKSLLQSPATPDLLPKPNNTAEFPHGRVVVVQVAIITQSTFCIT